MNLKEDPKTPHYEMPISGGHPDGICPNGLFALRVVTEKDDVRVPPETDCYRCTNCNALFLKEAYL